MRQPVPELTVRDLARVLQRDFPDHARAHPLLADMAGRLSLRARIAAVKSSAGSFDLLVGNLEQAMRDERDVIAGAEYPRFTALTPGADEARRDEAILADWDDYHSWLGRDA